MEGVIRASLVLLLERGGCVGIYAKARNGDSRSLPHLYWSWIRYVATEEGVTLPQSGAATDSLTEDEAKRLASALRARAEKIRKGLAVRDATSYVRQIDKQWFPFAEEGKDAGTLGADFDDPDEMDETANFFESSGGVVLRY
jgi:hypothetical protein